ncbi:hypothetical protein Goshw_008260 [Gossypium schwendimanii]|uniref:Uncharacterized protein n=1 Tax=Gossypium schwendimanii TaxID=34291 RepID=A0A7J9N5H5_GOSSC|nr:hypothetical protein [Gossypium schwendimanii]
MKFCIGAEISTGFLYLRFGELLDMLLYSCPMTTLEYSWWWGQRVNDNILVPNQEITR